MAAKPRAGSSPANSPYPEEVVFPGGKFHTFNEKDKKSGVRAMGFGNGFYPAYVTYIQGVSEELKNFFKEEDLPKCSRFQEVVVTLQGDWDSDKCDLFVEITGFEKRDQHYFRGEMEFASFELAQEYVQKNLTSPMPCMPEFGYEEY